VYYSPKLRKLIRINENEMVKALDNNKAFFDLVEVVDASGDNTTRSRYESKGKRDTESLKFNLAEDFAVFLNNKKYHVDKGFANSTEEYTSPTNPNNTYDNYQEYLFSSQEVGDRVEGDGHFSILSIDAVKIGESLFNNPKVTFERGDILGETKQEIIDKEELKPPVELDLPGFELQSLVAEREKAIKNIIGITSIRKGKKTDTYMVQLPIRGVRIKNSNTEQDVIDQIDAIFDPLMEKALKPTKSKTVSPQGFKDKFNKKNCKK